MDSNHRSPGYEPDGLPLSQPAVREKGFEPSVFRSQTGRFAKLSYSLRRSTPDLTDAADRMNLRRPMSDG